MVTYADMFTYSLVLIGLASLIFTVTRHKNSLRDDRHQQWQPFLLA